MRMAVPFIFLFIAVGAGVAVLDRDTHTLWTVSPELEQSAERWRGTVGAVVNAKVITLDAGGRVAEAVAIRDGRFAAIGSNDEIQRLVESWPKHEDERAPRVIDAGARTVIPGLIDSHVHALMVAAAEAKQPFAGLSSIAEIQDWIRKEAKRVPAGTWIWSPRIFPTRVREHRFPTRAELDAAAPDHPVAIDGAYAWMVNTAALRAANITSDTPNPPGGAIVKDASGEPTGLLRNVGDLLGRFRGASDDTVPLEMLDRVHQAYAKAGITSVIERGATMDGWRAYEALRRERTSRGGGAWSAGDTSNPLRVRAAVTIRIPQPNDAAATEAFVLGLPFKPGDGDEWLAARQLKIVADGGILAGTSYMRRPYGLDSRALYGVDDPTYRGFLTLTREQIASAIAIGHRHGWQMVAHVTGDAGVDAVLDAIEAAQATPAANAAVPKDLAMSKDRRHTLLHAYFANAETAARAARLGVPIDTQPAWYYKDADALLPALGAPRLKHFIGIRTWLDAGVHVALNTDHMFGLDPNTSLNPFNPFLTIATAVTRRTEGGQVIGGLNEAITRQQALRLMTIEAARLSFDEARKGSIEVGKLADLTMLSADPLTVPDTHLRAITSEITIVGGRITYERKR